MGLKRLLGAAVLLSCSLPSYSEQVFGVTQNAASAGYNWVMTQILPEYAGLAVNGVVYQYTTVKETEDEMLVHVQNENARGNGYIFRETDDWSGLPSNTITKSVPVPLIDASFWGPGSIEVEGKGSVEDAEVFYSYQYDTCFDPQSSPECPGYIAPIAIQAAEVVDPLDDEYIQAELDRKANMRAQKEEEQQRALKKLEEALDEEDERLEILLGIRTPDEFSAEQIALHNQLAGVKGLPPTYLYSLIGGTYQDTIVLKDTQLPNSRRGLRVGLAQELKHQELVNLQYAR